MKNQYSGPLLRLACLFVATILATACNRTPAKAKPLPADVQAKHKAVIIKQADQMQQKLLAGDLDGFIAYLDPVIVDGIGDTEKIKEVMAPGLAYTVETVQRITIGEVSEVCVDGERLVALFPITLYCRIGDDDLVQNGYRIACSRNRGESWTFMEGQGKKDQETFFKQTFPVFTKRVAFPECSVKTVEDESPTKEPKEK
jgi:hypothetical protein